MNRQNKILIIVAIIVLVFVLVINFWPKREVVFEKKTIKTIPASVIIIPTQDKTPIKSETGAEVTILSDDKYKEQYLNYTLRQVCPLKNDYFEINYDYGTDKFVVNIAKENIETFLQWKKDTGYNFITDSYWQIQIND